MRLENSLGVQDMKLHLNNVGIIKDSEVKLQGLTVITGKNSSGKTTVGKTIYSLISAGNNTVEAFDESRRLYICSQLLNIERLSQIRRIARMRFNQPKEGDVIRKTLWELAMHRFIQLDAEELFVYLLTLKSVLNELTPEKYKSFCLESLKDESSYADSLINYVYDNFYEWQQKSLAICQTTLDITGDENAYYNFVKDRTVAYLNHEFNKQIRPISVKGATARIVLEHQNKIVVDARVKSSTSTVFSKESTFVYPYNRCIFIDNPFVIDRLQEFSEKSNSLRHSFDERAASAIITSDDIESHDDILLGLLLESEKKNYFDDVEIQTKYKSVFEQINKVVPGEFFKGTNGFFYVTNGTKLSVNNLATGSKMFFIIKKLLINGLLNDGTMLVLDEPESHLHPDWINKFAEMLVVLVKNINVNVLLTTHSPNLLLAISVYTKQYDLVDKTNFYLADIGNDGSSHIKDIKENINEGYAHLSLPLVEMNIKLKKFETEGN